MSLVLASCRNYDLATSAMTSLRVNGVSHEIRSDASTPLVHVLRDELRLTGTKLGCELELPHDLCNGRH
jgi:hypothetical protein